MPIDIEQPGGIAAQEASLELGGTEKQFAELIRSFISEEQKARDDRKGDIQKERDTYIIENALTTKEDPDVPFPNSSDLAFPFAKEDLRKMKPLFVNTIFAGAHTVRFVAPSASSDTMEAFYDLRYKCKLPHFRKTVNAVAHRMLSKGKAFVKVTFEHEVENRTRTFPKDEQLVMAVKNLDSMAQAYESGMLGPQASIHPRKMIEMAIAAKFGWDSEDAEDMKRVESVIQQVKAGDEVLAAIIEVEVKHYSEITPILDHAALTYEAEVPHIQDSEWVCEEKLVTERALVSDSKKYGGKYRNVEALLAEIKTVLKDEKTLSGDKDAETTAKQNEDSDGNRTLRGYVQGFDASGCIKGRVRLHERHCFLQKKFLSAGKKKQLPDGDQYVKAIVTYCPDVDPEVVGPLRTIEYPYDFNGRFRWCYWNWNHNETGEGILSGQGLPEMGAAYYMEEKRSRDAALDRTTLITTPNRYVRRRAGAVPGSFNTLGRPIEVDGDPTTVSYIEQWPALNAPLQTDAQMVRQNRLALLGISDMSGMPNYQDSPTKAEVQAYQQPSQNIIMWELGNWVDGWNKVFEMAFLIDKQLYFFGRNKEQSFNSPTDSVGMKVTQQDFEQEYIIFAGGDFTRIDPAMEAQKMQAAMATMNSDPALKLLVNPVEAGKTYLNDFIGPSKTGRIINKPEDYQRFMQQFVSEYAQAMAAKSAPQRGGRGGGGAPKNLAGESAVNTGALAGA